MLKMPRLAGAAQLRLFVEEIGFERACKVVQTHPTTMRRWLREASPVPQAVLQALYWLTSYGFSDAFAEAHWTHQELLHRLRQARAELPDRLHDAPAANEPDYHAPGLVVPLQLA